MKRLLQKLSVLCLLIMVSAVTWADATTIFDAAASGWSADGAVTSTTTVGDVTWYGLAAKSALGSNNLTFSDNVAWTKYIKTGGGSTFKSGSDLVLVFTYTPTSAGTIKVYAQGGGATARKLFVSQSITSTNRDVSTALDSLDGTGSAQGICTATVESDKMVYIWGSGSMLVYGITFEASSPEPTPSVDPFSKNPATTTAYGYGAKATGGAGGTIKYITTQDELAALSKSTTPTIAIIKNDITVKSQVSLAGVQNLTLLGLPGVKLISTDTTKVNTGILKFTGNNSKTDSENIIIRNITFVGPGAKDVDGNDLLSIDGMKNAWIDHCDFQDGSDDCMDFKASSDVYDTDSITVSWCRFHYLKEPFAGGNNDHRFANLIGNNAKSAPKDSRYTMTWAYNWWDEGCVERMVRMRNSDMHFLNNVWNSSVAKYFAGPEVCSGRFDGCWFGTPTAKHYDQYVWCKQENTTDEQNPVIFTDCYGESTQMTSHGTVPAVSYAYGYDTADDAYTLVTNTITGAGATLNVDEQGNISMKEDTSKKATISWAIGNESDATLSDGISDYVSTAGVKVGSALETTVVNNYKANNGVSMVQYSPGTATGCDATTMVEYTVQVKKGCTFKPTSVSYDAIKVGTDGAYFTWSYTVDGVESTQTAVAAGNILRDNNTTGTPALGHTETISSDGGQKFTFRFYISNASSKKIALSNIKINGKISGEPAQRAFKDFKIDFRSNPYTVSLPESGTLPSGVEVSGSWNDGQHGYKNGTVVVSVDGPVKFTVGGCGYGKDVTVKNSAGNVIATLATKAAGCDSNTSTTQNVVWTYNSETAETLTFTYQYLPYFYAAACDLIPMRTVTYYDVDGTTKLAEEEVEGGSALVYNTDAEAKVTVAEGYKFRGWFTSTASTATKVAAGTSVDDNLSLYAKATEEEIPVVGKIFSYPLNSSSFYIEDHEAISSTGAFHDATHGYSFANGQSVSIKVAGNAVVQFGLCSYTAAGVTMTVTDGNGENVGEPIDAKGASDGATTSVTYTGEATTLTATFSGSAYLHNVTVYNVNNVPGKKDGYYQITAGDAASLQLVLAMLEDGDKVYLPNGTYDFGEKVLTTISASNVSIIGESMEGTIIKNAPAAETESINNTATIKNTGTGVYFQDLTIRNDLDYYKNNNGRAVCLWDLGNKTICKNVNLMSYQDTYYSNKAGSTMYFDDGEIHGTVDYICGNASVYFKNVDLICEQRKTTGGGADAITASNAAETDKGYVFEGCTIKYAPGITGTLPKVSLGRSWQIAPQCVFLNTIVDNTNGTVDFHSEKTSGTTTVVEIERWTLAGMNVLPKLFGEYNTKNEKGEVISPAENNVTFTYNGTTKDMNTILSATDAEKYTMAYTLGDWTKTAQSDVAQVTVMPTSGTFLLEDGTITTTVPTKGIVRVANSRGGFGPEINLSSDVKVSGDVTEESVKPAEGVSKEEAQAAVQNVIAPSAAVTSVETGLATAVDVSKVSFEKEVDPSTVSCSLNVVYQAATVANASGAVVTAMTFEVSPQASATGTDGNTYTTKVGNNALTSTVTFRLPVDKNADYAYANVKHENDDFGKLPVETAEGGDKYIELKVSSFSTYSYELTNDAPTAINAVDAKANVKKAQGKYLQNGQIVIIKDGKKFTVAGQQVK